MKNLMGGVTDGGGGTQTICVSYIDTHGPLNSLGNVMCMSVPSGFTCTDESKKRNN